MVVRFLDANRWSGISRVAEDNWRIDACPHHGPGLAIDADGTYHAVWATGESPRGPGSFYARSVDQGGTFSTPLPIGAPDTLAHADVAGGGPAGGAGLETEVGDGGHGYRGASLARRGGAPGARRVRSRRPSADRTTRCWCLTDTISFSPGTRGPRDGGSSPSQPTPATESAGVTDFDNETGSRTSHRRRIVRTHSTSNIVRATIVAVGSRNHAARVASDRARPEPTPPRHHCRHGDGQPGPGRPGRGRRDHGPRPKSHPRSRDRCRRPVRSIRTRPRNLSRGRESGRVRRVHG